MYSPNQSWRDSWPPTQVLLADPTSGHLPKSSDGREDPLSLFLAPTTTVYDCYGQDFDDDSFEYTAGIGDPMEVRSISPSTLQDFSPSSSLPSDPLSSSPSRQHYQLSSEIMPKPLLNSDAFDEDPAGEVREAQFAAIADPRAYHLLDDLDDDGEDLHGDDGDSDEEEHFVYYPSFTSSTYSPQSTLSQSLRRSSPTLTRKRAFRCEGPYSSSSPPPHYHHHHHAGRRPLSPPRAWRPPSLDVWPIREEEAEEDGDGDGPPPTLEAQASADTPSSPTSRAMQSPSQPPRKSILKSSLSWSSLPEEEPVLGKRKSVRFEEPNW